jgi:hypothetical protein
MQFAGTINNSGTLEFTSFPCPADSGVVPIDSSDGLDGLVSFYEFEGNALDKLGNHNGTEHNAKNSNLIRLA